jgi:hypothetical protein
LLAKAAEKSGDRSSLEAQAGRRLHQYPPQLFAKGPGFCCKAVEVSVDILQALFMRDCAGQLDGKAKAGRHAVCPPLVSFRPVRPIEGRIDLDRVKH